MFDRGLVVPPEAAGYYLLNPFEDWVKGEGVPIHRGFGVDCLTLDVAPSPRMGGLGAYIDLRGRGDYCAFYLAEIPAGAALNPERHVYEEVIYVLSGRGSTSIELPDGSEHVFEWHAGSLFAIPLNLRHRHFNGDGQRPARLAMISNLPLVLNLFHDHGFVFENPYVFESRKLDLDYLRGKGEYKPVRAGRNQWQTLLVPDLRSFELPLFDARGPGSKHLHFVLADSPMHVHSAEIPAGRYKKAHRHRAGAHIFCVEGKGYTLFWLEGQTFDEAVRVDWRPGTVDAPPEQYFHQHFNLKSEPARYLAIGFANVRYPITADNASGFERFDVDVREGGKQIEYEDQDPRIQELYEQELALAGVSIDMEPLRYRNR